MQKFLLVFVVAIGFAGMASGKDFPLPDKDNAFASVTIPDEWKPETYDNGVEAVSDDGEVYLAIETVGGESLDKSIDDAMAYLKKQGVTVDDETAVTKEGKLGEMDVVHTNWDGKDADGKCRVTLSIVAVSKGHGLLVIYWASPKGDQNEANTKALDAIANSIKPL
jgi:hypothetical protein